MLHMFVYRPDLPTVLICIVRQRLDPVLGAYWSFSTRGNFGRFSIVCHGLITCSVGQSALDQESPLAGLCLVSGAVLGALQIARVPVIG